MPQTLEDSLVFSAVVFFLQKLKKKNSPSSAPVIVNTLLHGRFFFFTRNYWQPQTGKHHHTSGCFSDGDQKTSDVFYPRLQLLSVLGSLL